MTKKNNKDIEIIFCGATDDEVTGSCTFLNIDGLNILVDFGLIQDNTLSIKELYKLNKKELPVPISKIDYVLLTSAHSDHQTSVGRLAYNGFEGKILTTYLNAKIMEPLLYDSAFIQLKETTAHNKKKENEQLFPLYTKSDVQYIMNFVQGYDFYKKINISDKVTVEFIPAGHVAGSASIIIEYKKDEFEKKRLFFSGDISAEKIIPFTMKSSIEKQKFDFMFLESTYGNRLHDKVNTESDLEKHITNTVLDKKAVLFIPVFSYHRSTVLIAMLKDLYEKRKDFNDIKVYLASPLAITVHKIITEDDSFQFYDKEWEKYKDLFDWDKIIYIDNFKDVENVLANETNAIVLSSSGMVSGGYASFLISKYIENKNNKILFSGYQAVGTLGNKLQNNTSHKINIDGVDYIINADIDLLKNMSSHADGKQIVDYVKQVEKKKVKIIALNHGSEDAKKALKERLKEEFDCEIIIPKHFNKIRI